jgi:hypothetical protein
MGNRYGARADEFAWTLGVQRRLKRYLQSELTYAEIGLLLGVSRGAVAGAVDRFKLNMTVEQQRDHQARQAWERAITGQRQRVRDWDSKLIESWNDRKRRLAAERAALERNDMEDTRTYCLRRTLEGASRSQIAKELGVTKNVVTGHVHRNRDQVVEILPAPAAPPSAAMLRLAQFDPVVAKAVELRRAAA